MKKVHLWQHQSDALDYLLSDGPRKRLVVLPTGSGKSNIEKAAASIKAKNGRKVIIATPGSDIVRSISRPSHLVYGKKVVSFQSPMIPIEAGPSGTTEGIEYLRNPMGRVCVMTHALLLRIVKELESSGGLSLAKDLVLIVDEVHHDGEDETELNRVCDLLYSTQNIALWGFTACAMRADDAPVFAEVEPFMVPYSKLAGAGLGFPTEFEIQLFELETPRYREGTPEDRYASELSDNITIGEHLATVDRPTVLHLALGSEKGRAYEVAEEIRDAMVGMGVDSDAIFNSITAPSDNTAEIRRAINAEQEAIESGGYAAAAYRCIISQQRFKEGADWPIGAHACFKGLETSLPSWVQKIGRVLRTKQFISGYPAQWRDNVLITVFVPRDALLEFDQREGLLHLCCYLEAVRAVQLVQHLWEELADHLRVPPAWRYRVSNELDITRSAANRRIVIDRKRLVALALHGNSEGPVTYPQWVEGVPGKVSPIDPNDQPLGVVMTLAAELLSEGELLEGKRMEGKAERAIAALGRMLTGVDPSAFEDKLKESFLALLATEDFGTSPITAGDLIGIKSNFNVADMVRVATHQRIELQKMESILGDEKWVLEKVLLPYEKHYGRPPFARQDNAQDVSHLVGMKLTLSQLDHALRAKGFSGKATWMCRHFIQGPPLDSAKVEAAVKKVLPKFKAYELLDGFWGDQRIQAELLASPKYESIERRLAKVLGRQESLVGLELAYSRGWRGLPTGGSLLDFYSR